MALWEKLGLDNRDFNKSMDESKGKVKEFEETTQDASQTVDDLSKHGTKSTRELLKQMSELDKSNRSVSNYRRQLAQLTRDIADLTINYRNMSKEMQNSQLGRETVMKIQELSKEAAHYKDSIQDAQNSIKNLASDTAGWDAAKQGISAVSGALQLVASSGMLGAKNSEQLVKVIARLKTIESAANSVIAIGNALQKDSALMTGIRALQSKALAKAQLEEATATEVASAAQSKFNIIANANPYVLLASVAIAAVAGIVAFSNAMDENAKKAEEAKKDIEEYRNSIAKFADASGEAAFKFDELKEAYAGIRTEGEKQRFMEEYKSKLSEIGINITNVSQLEDVFGNSSDAFREACMKRAEAMAYTQVIMEEYQKAIKATLEAEHILSNIKPGQRINEGDPAYDLLKQYGAYTDDVARLGRDYVNVSDDFYEKVISGIDAGSKKTIKTLRARQKDLMDQYAETTKGLNDAAKAAGDAVNNASGGKKGGKSDDQKAMEGSITYLNEQISLVKKLKDQQVVGTEEWAKWQTILEDLNQQLDEAIGKEKRLTTPKFEKIDPIDVPANLVIPNQVVPVELSPEMKRDKLVEQFKKAQDEVSRIQGWLDLGVIGKQEAQKLVDEINNKLSGKGIDFKLSLKFDEEAINTAVDAVSKLTDKYTQFGEVADNIVSPINSVYEAFKGLGDKLKESENGWEQFFTVFQAGMTILESFSRISKGIATAMDLINTLQAAGIITKKADTQATRENTKANIENAGSKAAEAVAGATNSAAQTPIIGWVLAIAAAASVLGALMATMSKAKGFASGGIIPGNSFSGDKQFARVNSGELVINTEQQKKLWDFIKNGSRDNEVGGTNQVEFVLRGQELVGLMNNTIRKNSRL